jgi:hypothetical protein
MPFWAADLDGPIAVEATSSGHNKDSYPKWSQITYDFPKNDWRPAIKLYWHDGGKKPPRELFHGAGVSGGGSLIVGDKGSLYSDDSYGARYKLLGGASKPKVEYERSPGHVQEWIRAMREDKPASSDFANHGGPLTETVLLGNLAVWSGKRVEWDAKNLKAKGMPELDAIIKREYRKGYSL